MAGKKNSFQLLLFSFFLFFLFQGVIAQLSVSVEPLNPVHETRLYVNEVAEFKITAINLTGSRVMGEQFQVLASDGVVLIENGFETDSQSFLVPELLPNQAIELAFFAKAKRKPVETAALSVNFGREVFSDLVAKKIRIVPCPLAVSLQLQKKVLHQGETAKLNASFQNVSEKPIQRIHSELLDSLRGDTVSVPLDLEELLPNQKQENVLFEFWPKPLATGEHNIGIQTFFTDENGFHALDHRVEVIVSEESRPLIWLVVIVILFLIAFVAWNRTISKPPMELRHNYQKRFLSDKEKDKK